MGWEKHKLLIRRLLLFFLIVAGIVICVIVYHTPIEDAELIEDNGYIVNYYSDSDESDCKIEATFDIKVGHGYITVVFYDAQGKLLSRQTGHFTESYSVLTNTFYGIKGKVDSYRIEYYELYAANFEFVSQTAGIVGLFALIAFIYSLFLSCKTYDYYDSEILVYAGFYHNYIKIDGVKYDEHNTFRSLVPIYLDCELDDGTYIEATISTFNRIALKINNKLYRKGAYTYDYDDIEYDD